MGYKNFSVSALDEENFNSNAVSSEKQNQINDYEIVVSNFIEPFFGDKSISNFDYIYNFDGNSDYIYVEFESGGYVVYAKETMEMLEYSLEGSLPYSTSTTNYYAGPSNYYYRNDDNYFVDILTGDEFNLSNSEISNLSDEIRNGIINENVTKYDFENFVYTNDNIQSIASSELYSSPDINTENLIAASTSNGYLIANYKYFLSEPTIGDNYSGETYGNNNTGTCGPIAAQLLLSYNNFCVDRRIIEDRFLNGYDDDTNTVTETQKNPNYCTDPVSMTSYTTGTRSDSTGTNSFYYEMINRIMKPNTDGSSISQVKNGINDYLSERLSSDEYSIDSAVQGWFFGYSAIDSTSIINEIKAGRPLIISMSSNLGGSNHFVVGYGYQDYTYEDGSGTYNGYVAHFGWQGSSRRCVWINSSWCDGYISLKTNHIHDYDTVGQISNTNRIECKCSTCGHRTDSAINMNQFDRYIETTTTLSYGEIQYYYLTFATSGNKLIQTFGTKDTLVYLYDSEYNLLAVSDDSGYSLNSFISYTVSSDTAYILRIRLNEDSTSSGQVKIGITPSQTEYESYDDIRDISIGSKVTFVTTEYNTCVLTFTPLESSTYTFDTYYMNDNSIVDTYLYVIDPTSTRDCTCDDDSGGDYQASITIELEAGRSYFIIVSANLINSSDEYLIVGVNQTS